MQISDLSPEDLRRLREETKRALHREGVPAAVITDKECDRWIAAVLPATAEAMIRRRVETLGRLA